MLFSMTGYSTSRVEEERFSLAFSVKTTNHRFLDLQLRLPAAIEPLETKARSMVSDQVRRGHVEVTVGMERQNGAGLRLDHGLLDAYFKAFETLRREYIVSAQPDLVALLRIPGVVVSGGEVSEEEMDRVRAAFDKGLAEALERLNTMRRREGEALARDIQGRLAHLEELGKLLGTLAGSMEITFRERLEKRVRELALDQQLEPVRLAQEVTALVLRADIAEEVTRFKSHVSQAQLLVAEEQEAGKKLDFLLQEMNREANTVLSKTTGVPETGLKIAGCAMEMKVEIEKLREQAQNIE